MKKNLLSILILVLLIVNIALTSVMMISVTGTNSKTAALVDTIATVMNLELTGPAQDNVPSVSLADTVVYDIRDMMIPLAASVVVNEDGTTEISNKQSYFIFTLSLSQNTKHEDYETLGGDNLATRETLINAWVNDVVGKHTLEDCKNNLDGIKDEILKAIQTNFGSDFIYKIDISGIKFG